MPHLIARTLFACFAAFFASSCRSGDNPSVKPEPAPETITTQTDPVASTTSASPFIAALEPTPAPSASAMVAESESSATAPVEARPKGPPPIPLPRVRPLKEHEVAAVLVRSKPKGNAKPEESTQLIHADGKATLKKGFFVFINRQLHQYHRREDVSPNPPCPGEKENIFPKRIWRNAEFVPEKKGKTLELIQAYKPKPKSDDIVHTETDHELVAALPGFVFIKSSETDWGCGAHPLYGNSFVLAAIGPEGAFEKISESDYLEGTDAWIEHAQAKFNSQVDPGESPDSLDGRIQNSSDVKAVMAFPMITAKGAVWAALFTAPATWAGSYGGWGGYTRAMPMPINKTPARFRDAMVTPEPVNDYVAKHEKDEEILGFTVGETE